MKAYMCKTEFECELRFGQPEVKPDGHTYAMLDPMQIYTCEEALRKHEKCADTCGIVEIEVTLSKVIQNENFSSKTI